PDSPVATRSRGLSVCGQQRLCDRHEKTGQRGGCRAWGDGLSLTDARSHGIRSVGRRIEMAIGHGTDPCVLDLLIYGHVSSSFTTPKSMVESSVKVEPAGTFCVQTCQLLSITWLRLPARSWDTEKNIGLPETD